MDFTVSTCKQNKGSQLESLCTGKGMSMRVYSHGDEHVRVQAWG